MPLLPDRISKKRPTGVMLASLFLFFVPFVLLGMLAYGYHNHYEINWRLEWVVAVASLVSWITSFGVVKVKQWGYFMLFATFATTLILDISHIIDNPKTFNAWDVVDFVVVAVGLIAFLIKRNRGVYFDPKMRWWDRAPRFKTNLVGEFSHHNRSFTLPVIILSKSGCFATYGDDGHLLDKGDILKIKLRVENVVFESNVRVVTGRDERHGYGMGFVDMDSDAKKNIKAIIRLVRPRFKLNPKVA